MKNLLFEICRGLLILLFAYTATSKFLDYNLFVFQMMRAPVPIIKSIAPVLGWLMPTIEASLVLALLWPKTKIRAMIVSIFLLVVFEIYILAMVLSGLSLPCTCGGIISSMSWMQHLIFNGVLILIGIVALRFQEKKNHYNTLLT